jgi:hypothetical protein
MVELVDITGRHRRVRVPLIALGVERPPTLAIRTIHSFRNDGSIYSHASTIAGSSREVQGV